MENEPEHFCFFVFFVSNVGRRGGAACQSVCALSARSGVVKGTSLGRRVNVTRNRVLRFLSSTSGVHVVGEKKRNLNEVPFTHVYVFSSLFVLRGECIKRGRKRQPS